MSGLKRDPAGLRTHAVAQLATRWSSDHIYDLMAETKAHADALRAALRAHDLFEEDFGWVLACGRFDVALGAYEDDRLLVFVMPRFLDRLFGWKRAEPELRTLLHELERAVPALPDVQRVDWFRAEAFMRGDEDDPRASPFE